ncbi:Spo0B domain-containing protein [Clostridiisalibacter paucivorans]|uniref:Spo0B domain-containing protein n=1 Tax=Clostridiisalibacter paucivorans TaxID=408753 RepID=UPI00047DBE07|nr:Spo0B domain-containing protein [Clostridiisalibacter paucivorans]
MDYLKDNKKEENLIKKSYLIKMVGLCREYRHDYMNNFQILLGYLQTNNYDRAVDYIKNISEINIRTKNIYKLSLPEVSIFLDKKIREFFFENILLEFNVIKNIKKEIRVINNEVEIIKSLEKFLDKAFKTLDNIDILTKIKIDVIENEEKIDFIINDENNIEEYKISFDLENKN